MDLVLRGADGTDIMLISPESAEFAYGDSENDMEIRFPDSRYRPAFARWGYVFAPGTDYGGLVTRVASESGRVKWKGWTWSGLLANKVLVPDSGQDYLTVSGEANAVIGRLVERCGLAACMAASTENSRKTVGPFRFDLYTDAWTGIRKMLATVGCKLRIRHDGEKAVLSAVEIRDWSEDEAFDSDLVDVRVDVDYQPVNHLVCRGVDEKQNRVSAELYADASGNVSETQTFKGVQERAEYYDFTTAERDKLVEDGAKRLKGYWEKAQTVKVELSASDDRFDIDDIVGGIDSRTGIAAKASITKKVVTVDSMGNATVEYET